MNEAILMSASADNIDFMIHGLFSFQLFGQEVWITTSHVCIAIVMLVLVIFSIVANRKIAHATEVPDTFQNVLELMVEKIVRYRGKQHGFPRTKVYELYLYDLRIYIVQ